MNIEDAKEILNNVNELIDICNAEKEKNGDDFNLLEISGISRLEVNMCRILAELLKPDGIHYQKDLFLKSFVRNILKIEASDDEFERASVYTEYPTDTSRRIDIAIETPLRLIPIEAKLYAKDQESQCGDYYNFAKNKSEITSKVYYLTLDGHLPYEDDGLTSIKQNGEIIGYEELVTLSFCDDVYIWLDSVMESVKDKTMLYASLVQLKNALGRMGGKMNKKLHNDISALISENNNNMKTALAIAESITVAKENLMIKLFERFEEEMNHLNFPLEQLYNKFDYKYDDYSSVRTYYSKKRNKIFPSLVYRYKKFNAGKEIWFKIEVGNYGDDYGDLYCGFVTAKNGNNPNKVVLSKKEIAENMNMEYGYAIDDWFFYYEFLPEHDEAATHSVDFRTTDSNQKLYDLFDDEKYEEFVKACMTRIKILLDKMLVTGRSN